MNKFYMVLAALGMMTAHVSIAQERAAAGALDTQMTWSTLSNQVKTAQKYAEGVNSRVDQAVECGKKGLVYAAGHPDAVNGCLSAKYLDKLVDCGRQSKIYSSATNTCVVPTDLTNILDCGKDKKVYSSSTKKCESVDGGTRWYAAKVGPGMKGFPNMMSRENIERQLKEAGYVECNLSHKMTVGRKCATQGMECAIVSMEDRSCGSHGDSYCRDWSSMIYRCD